MKHIIFLFCFFSQVLFSQEPLEEVNDFPFVAPYTFMTLADFIYKNEESFDPGEVFEGAIIYSTPLHLKTFFLKTHKKIKNRYILITHGADRSVPGQFKSCLEDPKIIAWLGRNPSIKFHKKFHPIPIGINARQIHAAKGVMPMYQRINQLECPKEHLLYMNMNIGTNEEQRGSVYKLFSSKPYCYCCSRKPMEEYLMDMKKSHFVLSPTGRGLDCFRTWEAILVGSIPVVTPSYLDPLFKDLPVLIVKDWKDINPEFLNQKIEEFKSREFPLDKLYISFWREYINKLLRDEGITNRNPFHTPSL